MAKAKGFGSVADDGDRPIPKKNSKSTPSTVDGTPNTWEERNVRRTFYIDSEMLDRAKAHAKGTGESLSSLIARGVRELLDRETS